MDIVVQETAAQLVLLGMAWWPGIGFPTFLLLLAGEAVIVMMLGSATQGRRSVGWHIRALVSLVGGLAIFFAFQMLVYGTMTAAAGQSAFGAALEALRMLDVSMLGWGLLYATGHLAIALWIALRGPDPRTAFAQQGQMQAGMTILALVCAIPVVLLGGGLAAAVSESLGLVVPFDAVAIVLLMTVRYAFLLRFCRYSMRKWAEIVDSFYLT